MGRSRVAGVKVGLFWGNKRTTNERTKRRSGEREREREREREKGRRGDGGSDTFQTTFNPHLFVL